MSSISDSVLRRQRHTEVLGHLRRLHSGQKRGSDCRRVSDKGDEITLASCLHLQDGKGGLGVLERDPFDRARQRLSERTSALPVARNVGSALIFGQRRRAVRSIHVWRVKGLIDAGR